MVDGVRVCVTVGVLNRGVLFVCFVRRSLNFKNIFFRSMKYLRNILHTLLVP